MEYDEFYLSRAFELARRGRFTTAPNPNVGCVLVYDNKIVGEGYHVRAGEPHAEICALRMAGDTARNSTAYVTLEPCNHQGRTPSCAEALIKAGVIRVVMTILDPNPQVAGRGFYRLQQAGIEICHGLMKQEAEAINKGFLKRMRTGLPIITLKLAASLDGRTAMCSGESKWITSLESRQDVQLLRAESDAILSTSATILADNPMLNVRWQDLPKDVQQFYAEKKLRQPIRIIIDSFNRVLPTHRVIQGDGQTWLARLEADNNTWPVSVEQLQLPSHCLNGIYRLDLKVLMKHLGSRQINSILVEAGANLAGALLTAGLVDELIIYQAPKLLGINARPLCVLHKIKYLRDVPNFELLEILQLGPDIRLRLKPCKSHAIDNFHIIK